MGNSCTKPKAGGDDEFLPPSKQVDTPQSLPTPRIASTPVPSFSVPSPPPPIPSFTQKANRSSPESMTAMSKARANGTGADRACGSDAAAARLVVAAHDDFIQARDPSKQILPGALELPLLDDQAASYERAREELTRREAVLAFDHPAISSASPLERQVSDIIAAVRARDDVEVYAAAPPRTGFGGQQHVRFAGDHFLSNGDLVPKTGLFRIAQRMPKGAHLHIHFNACLLPRVLLGLAAKMDCMCIMSNVPLGPDTWLSSMIEFSILSSDKASEKPGDLFSAEYESKHTMRFKDFLDQFPTATVGCSALDWLESKITFGEDEAHSLFQTSLGAWQKFDSRTRMMKGLFNYETAFRTYLGLLLDDFARDNVQYAEIRPNFMKTNQLWSDDGTRTIDNVGIMDIITTTTSRFLADNQDSRFRGLKVIYCTPRVLGADSAAHALDECIAFKQRWPEWIAGFDLVGEEAAGHSLRFYAPQLLAFRARCDQLGLDIPFLLHCGESVDAGSESDGNLLDALLLGAKRIGHGFALPRHPYVMERMKSRGICLELCPISNEILGLTPRVGGHAMYGLLANNVHCTVSSDNGTLFRSSLSHDFYQTMVGKKDMSLFGWKQLIEWSLEHACMTPAERADVHQRWRREWDDFLHWVVAEYGEVGEVVLERP